MYYIVFILGLLLSFLKRNKIYFYFFLGILLLLAIFRFGVGADYFSYQYLYQQLLDNPIEELKYGIANQELLFRFIGSISKNLGFSYQLYLSIFAIVNLVYISKTVLKYSQKPMMSLFLYYSFFYFVWTFSGLRQGVVLAIGIYYFLTAYEKKNTVNFTLITIILSLIHTSVLILIPLYYISNLNWSQKRLILLSSFSLIVSLLPLGPIISLISQIPLFSQASNYIFLNNSLINWLDFQGIARLVFLVFGLVYYRMLSDNNTQYQFIINTFIISLNMYFLLSFSELIAARLSIYGFYLIILIIPNISSRYKTKVNRLAFQVIVITLSVLFFAKELYSLQINSNLILLEDQPIPYTNIYNKYDGYYFDNRYLDILAIE